MMMRSNILHLVKYINLLLPKYRFGEPTQTTLGAYLPIYKTVRDNTNAFIVSQDMTLNGSCEDYVGYFILNCIGIRNLKTFTLFGIPIGNPHLDRILKDWESIGIKHEIYFEHSESPNPTPDLNGYVYYKLWLNDEK